MRYLLLVGLLVACRATAQAAPPTPSPTDSIYDVRAVERPRLANATRVARALTTEYPRAVRDLGQGGETLLRMVVEKDGQPSQIVILRTSGNHDIDEAAIRIARVMRFRPGRVDGQPVRVRVEIPLTLVPSAPEGDALRGEPYPARGTRTGGRP